MVFNPIDGYFRSGVDPTDENLKEVAEKCATQLKKLHCRGSGLTDKGIGYIAGNCHYLYELSVTDCKGVTDSSIIELAQGCHYLKRLYLVRCYDLTDKLIKPLAHKTFSRDLRIFTSHLSEELLQYFRIREKLSERKAAEHWYLYE